MAAAILGCLRNFIIDSTMPQIWTATDACKMFEDACRLSWNSDLELYVINDTTHYLLVQENPTVTFTIGATPQDGGAVNYTLPYSAFDLTLAPPLVNSRTYYFPLKRSPNGINLLGRAFLQEIYIVVDFERANFSISQAIIAEKRDIVAIFNTTYTGDSSGQPLPSAPPDSNMTADMNQNADKPPNSLTAGASAGIAIAVALTLLLVAIHVLAWNKGWWFFRKKHAEQARFDKAELHDDAKPRVEAMGKERAELPVNERSLEVVGFQPQAEVAGIHDLHELYGEGREGQ